MQDKTRKDKNSTESKVTRVAFNNYKKVPIAFWRSAALSATRHSAVQCWPRVVRKPQYHGHYLGTSCWTPVRVRWVASQHAKKTQKTIHNSIKNQKNLPTFLHTLCMKCAGSVRARRWRMRPWTSRDTDAMKSLVRVHHCPSHASCNQTPAVIQATRLTAFHMDEANRWPW